MVLSLILAQPASSDSTISKTMLVKYLSSTLSPSMANGEEQ